jgi:hypothetical protein|tara:strand:- start:9 stop:635 length:627 start_codon:yes stop_codon:yes gene_type:complete
MLKHVGRMTNNQRRVVVAYRVVPGEPNQSIIVDTSSLMAEEHDALIKAVEGDTGQQADEFATVMARTSLPDGANMLARFHTTGKMMKVASDTVEMTPNSNTVIKLSELNQVIAEQKGVTIADLALPDANGETKKATTQATDPTMSTEELASSLTTPNEDGVLTDESLAAQYRSQADALFKEAKILREQAEELVPTKKKPTVKKTVESA